MYDFDFLSVFLHCSVCVWLMCGFAFTVCQCQYWHVMLHGNVRHFTWILWWCTDWNDELHNHFPCWVLQK